VTDVETRIRRLLAEVYRPEGIDIWMMSRNKDLYGRVPRDLIDAGLGEEVLDHVEYLAGGAW